MDRINHLLLRSGTLFLAVAVASAILIVSALAQDVPPGDHNKLPAEKRLALLIANQGYNDSVHALVNPAHDVKLLKVALERLGFNVVVQTDLGLVPMRRTVADYTKRLRDAGDNTVGFFYYSGHGAAASELGPNYLIPVDANFDSDELATVSEKLEDIIDELANVSNSVMQFVVFDACRSVLQKRERGGILGFLEVQQRRGMVMVFSTAPRESAYDEYPKGSVNGPFAAKFAEILDKSGKREDALLTDVQLAVQDFTHGGQSPYVVRTPVREFFFNEQSAVSNGPGTAAPVNPPVASVSTVIDELQAAIDTGSLAQSERDELRSLLQKIRARSSSNRPFTYYAPGDLLPGSGNGVRDMTNYAPEIVFPIDNAEAFVNSQTFGYGGTGWKGSGALAGSELDARNYLYPWRDNFCEVRDWTVPACPSGKGHQGVDIRAGTFDSALRAIVPLKGKDGGRVRIVAVEAGTVSLVTGNATIRLISEDGKRIWEYLNLCTPDVVVKVGQTVKAGDFLSYLGNCMDGQANATTYHLHLQLALSDGNKRQLVSPYITLVRAYERRVGVGSMLAQSK